MNASDFPELPEPVRRAVAAANARDTEAFLDQFTERGAVDDWGRRFEGREAVAGWSDREFIGVKVSLKVTGVTRYRDQVIVSAQVGGDGFNGPSDFAFTVDGDRIGLMRITG
ncbi:nuclear transport factor 2 family protein [Actinacidiphila sp. bgisy160]|uniref:nuclear transport factor 2 family protein n=1 Tax=Actinacidiphila sp. bgisy160 TaxID=3413796 RepID=UPI003D711E7F